MRDLLARAVELNYSLEISEQRVIEGARVSRVVRLEAPIVPASEASARAPAAVCTPSREPVSRRRVEPCSICVPGWERKCRACYRYNNACGLW